MIMSFGDIPLLYYGDELGTHNNRDYLDDPEKSNDSRWMHRPRIDWEQAELRNRNGRMQQRIFDGLRKMIAVCKSTPAFSDYNNR